MMAINYHESGDLARLKWTLEGGSSPIQRIYSTLKSLRSQMTRSDVERMIEDQVRIGLLKKEPHPMRENESFYALNLGHDSLAQSNIAKTK